MKFKACLYVRLSQSGNLIVYVLCQMHMLKKIKQKKLWEILPMVSYDQANYNGI